MEYRSTNSEGRYTHHGGALVVGVEFGSGVEINPNSSGNAASILPAGDEAAKSVRIGGKGTGGVLLGATSTTAFAAAERYIVQFTEPDLAASAAADSTYTVAGLTTNAVLQFTPRLPIAANYAIGAAVCSTADELKIRWINNSASTNSGSSNRGTLLVWKF